MLFVFLNMWNLEEGGKKGKIGRGSIWEEKGMLRRYVRGEYVIIKYLRKYVFS